MNHPKGWRQMGHAEKVAWLIYHWEQRPPTGAETDEIIIDHLKTSVLDQDWPQDFADEAPNLYWLLIRSD